MICPAIQDNIHWLEIFVSAVSISKMTAFSVMGAAEKDDPVEWTQQTQGFPCIGCSPAWRDEPSTIGAVDGHKERGVAKPTGGRLRAI